MTISSTITDVPKTANGSTTQFPFWNKIFAATDLVVTLTDLVGNIYVFTNFFNAATGLSYTVQNVDVDTGCSITFSAPPANGWGVDIRSLIPELQSTSVKNQGDFLPELHEEAFDRATRMIQDLLRITYTYGIHGPDLETTPWSPLPAAALRANLALMFNSSGLPTVGVPTTQTLTQTLIGLVLYPVLGTETGVVNSWYPYNTMLRFGIDPTGTNDSTNAVNNCLASCKAGGGGKVRVGWLSSGTIKLSGQVSWPVDFAGIDWEGAKLVCGATTSYTFQPTYTTTGTVADIVALLKSHPMENFSAIGPCTPGNLGAQVAAIGTGTETGFMNLSDPTAGNLMPGITIRNGGTYNFCIHFKFGAGAFYDLIDNFEMNTQSGGSGYYMVWVPAATNAGERNTISDTRLGSVAASNVQAGATAINLANGNADTRFTNVSLIGVGGSCQRLFTMTAGLASITEGHFESSTYQDNWVSISGTNTVLQVDDWTIAQDAALTTFSIFNVDASVTNGGLLLGKGNYISGANANPVPLVSGTGAVRSAYRMPQGSAGNPPTYTAKSLNQFSDPGFTTYGTFAADGWSTAGPTVPVINSANPAPGYTNNVTFGGTTGQTNTLNGPNIPCRAGQQVQVQVQMALTGFTAGTQFYCQVTYRNAAGTLLSAQNIVVLTATTAYAKYSTTVGGGMPPAPPGAVSANVQVVLVVGTTGPAGYLGEVIANVI